MRCLVIAKYRSVRGGWPVWSGLEGDQSQNNIKQRS